MAEEFFHKQYGQFTFELRSCSPASNDSQEEDDEEDSPVFHLPLRARNPKNSHDFVLEKKYTFENDL